MNQWKIGDVKISRIVESEAIWDGTFLLPNATAEAIKKERDWLYPAFSNEEGKVHLAIQALLIESQGKRIMVDTCIGNDKVRTNPEWNKLQLPFLKDLEKIGSPRESIDRVICTHLHIDHVGLEHDAQERQVGADVSQREVSAGRHRMGFLLAG